VSCHELRDNKRRYDDGDDDDDDDASDSANSVFFIQNQTGYGKLPEITKTPISRRLTNRVCVYFSIQPSVIFPRSFFILTFFFRIISFIAHTAVILNP